MVTEINIEGIPMEEYKKASIINNMTKGVKYDVLQTQVDMKRSTHKGIRERMKHRKPTRGKVRSLTALEIIHQYGKERILMANENSAAMVLELISKIGTATKAEIAFTLKISLKQVGVTLRWLLSKVGEDFCIVHQRNSENVFGFSTPETNWETVLEKYNSRKGIKQDPIRQKRKYTRRAVDVVVNEILQTTPIIGPNDQAPGTMSDYQTDAKLLMTQLSTLLEMGKMAIENFNRKYS